MEAKAKREAAEQLKQKKKQMEDAKKEFLLQKAQGDVEPGAAVTTTVGGGSSSARAAGVEEVVQADDDESKADVVLSVASGVSAASTVPAVVAESPDHGADPDWKINTPWTKTTWTLLQALKYATTTQTKSDALQVSMSF